MPHAVTETIADRTFEVSYEIRSLMDNYRSAAATGQVRVLARDEDDAVAAARRWVQDNDARYDERIDPAFFDTGCDEVEPQG